MSTFTINVNNIGNPHIFQEVREQVRSGCSPRKHEEMISSKSASPRSSSPRISKSLRRFTISRQSSNIGKVEVLSPSLSCPVKNEPGVFSENKDKLLELCKKDDEDGVSKIIDMCTVADLVCALDILKDGSIRKGLEVRLEYIMGA